MNFSLSLIAGLFLVLFGISILLRELFDISLPLVKVTLAIFLIYLGVTLILDLRIKNQQTMFFGCQTARPFDIKTSSYQTIFGESTIDLTNLSYDKKPVNLGFSTIFGKTSVYIDPNVATKIIAHSSFGEIILPDNSTVTCGTKKYNSHQTNPELILTTRTTFGQTIVKQKINS